MSEITPVPQPPGGELARLVDRFPIMEPDTLAEIRKTLDANVGPRGLNEQQLEKIRFPTGGNIMWMVPGLDGEEPLKELVGIIVGWRDVRLYWRTPYAERGKQKTPPDCASQDGFFGVGDPGGECASCPLAKYGSDPKGGRAQACKQVRQLLLLREQHVLPEVVNIPPTSHKAAQKYFLRLGMMQIPYWGLVSHLRLDRTQNLDGVDFARVNFIAGLRLTAAERQAFLPFQRQMESLFKALEVETDDYVVVPNEPADGDQQ